MKPRFQLQAGLVCRSLTVFLALMAWGGVAMASPAVDTVKELVDAIRSFQKSDGTPNTARIAHNREVITRAHGTLDIQGLAQRSLGKAWGKISKKDRHAFVGLLKDVFAGVAYPQSAKFFRELKMEFGEARARPDERISVLVEVSHPDEGLIDIEFFLTMVGGKPLVIDIELDGVSLGLDIRSQMQKIMREESYTALVTRMRDKLEKEGISP